MQTLIGLRTLQFLALGDVAVCCGVAAVCCGGATTMCCGGVLRRCVIAMVWRCDGVLRRWCGGVRRFSGGEWFWCFGMIDLMREGGRLGMSELMEIIKLTLLTLL
ncbi:hypothetical protein Lalb_Chr04g0250721 [Lupinus albus]|uniref:Secreted protein n=1 Tax=Lupinus albus TaxID=3870 RepID=A0A6A4QNE3_LUPAL|nr:hypothetical protein Lalb_Chr04g0250721 [Lupinus albus]